MRKWLKIKGERVHTAKCGQLPLDDAPAAPLIRKRGGRLAVAADLEIDMSLHHFTADDAFEAAEIGDPIMISHEAADDICRDHGTGLVDYLDELVGDAPFTDDIAADELLAWLGY